jgi:hypothetical protein
MPAMKNQLQQTRGSSIIPHCGQATSLHQLVNKLQLSLLSQAVNKKSFIINNIDKSVTVFAEENTLAYVIGSLLCNAVYSTSDCCIRVETTPMADQLQIRIRSNSAFAYSHYIHIAGNYVDAAKKLGGDIGLEIEGNNVVTLVFSLARNAA